MDTFDEIGKKIARAVFDVAELCDKMDEPLRSGGIIALEEFCFRITGKHWDWEEAKEQKNAYEKSLSRLRRQASQGQRG